MKPCAACKVNPRVVSSNKGRGCYCKQCWSDRSNKWNKENKERFHTNNIAWKFGMTAEQYAALLSAQGGACAICKEPCALGRKLAVDHNHKTEQNRGLLCFNCNTGLGKFRDSPAILQRAMEYLCSYMTVPKV